MNGPITWASAGDIVEVVGKDGLIETQMVSRWCKATPVAYFCTSHRVHLANLFNLSLHLEEVEGPHHFVAMCIPHRRAEAPDDVQMQALTGKWAA